MSSLQHKPLSVNTKDDLGDTPLLKAVKKKYDDLAKVLLEYKETNIFLSNDENETAINLNKDIYRNDSKLG